MTKYIVIIIPLLIPYLSFSQESNLSEVVVNIAEDLASDDSDPEAAETYIDRLYELAENPIKLNSSNEDEISKLFFLSDFQVKAIIDYVHSSGKILTVYELANIPGFDRETAEMMIPFITLNNNVKMNSDSVKWTNTSITNLSIKPGNNDTISLGSQWKILSKYKFKAGSFSGGYTVEKDPGEKFFSGNPPLPDFLSAHISYNGSGIIRRLIVGDYSARFGQGTNINTGIRTGLSLTAPGYMSASDEIMPYTSTDENNFFRGVAAEFSVKNLELFLFYSNNNIDATIASSTGASNDYIKSFYLAGIHNTSSLLLKKDAISEINYGINLSYNFNNVRIGLTWSEDKFSLPVKPSGNDPSNIFDFEGDRNNIYTFYYNSLIKRILIYGELSINQINKYAFIQGFSFRPSDRLTTNFLFRNYDPGFTSFYGKGPGTSSTTSNENGILGNFSFEAAKHLFISSGCDIEQYPWLKYRCSAPSRGMRQEISIRFLPNEKLTIGASYNYRYSMVDDLVTIGIPEQNQTINKCLKVSVRYSMYDNLIFDARIDYNVADPFGSKGMLLFQEINYRFRQVPLTLWFRYCLFNTDDWNSRIYTYENDLLYSFSIPALSGEGSRSYIMLKWKINKHSEMRIKYSITSLITNGVTIENTDEFKMQFKVWF